MHGKVLPEIAHTSVLQIVDRILDSGEVLLPDGDPGGLEYVAVSPLALAYFRLCPLPFGNVLDDAEDASRTGRLASSHVALAVDGPHLAVAARDAVLHVVAGAAPLRLRRRPHHGLPILRMDEILESGKVDGGILWRQPEDAVGLV